MVLDAFLRRHMQELYTFSNGLFCDLPCITSNYTGAICGGITVLIHVLYSYLPERRCLIYNLRERSHNRSLITKTSYLNEHDFFIRILYKHCYRPLMCVAVVALSLAILLLCFITFIVFYCPVAFVNS